MSNPSQGSSNIRIINCTINNCYYGLRPCNWSDIIIENCKISNCQEGIHLTSCGKSEDMPSKHSPLINAVINNCIISNTNTYGIWGRGKFAYNDSTDISYLDGVVVSNCKFKNCNGSSAIYLDVCKNIRTCYNLINDSARSIWLSSCKNAVIDGNICEAITNEGVFTSLTSLVDEEYKPRSKDIKVNNNTCISCGRNGIFVQYADDFIISNNFIENCSLEDNTRNGIMVAANNGFVSDNIVRGANHSKDIYVTSGSDQVFCNNNLASIILDSSKK